MPRCMKYDLKHHATVALPIDIEHPAMAGTMSMHKTNFVTQCSEKRISGSP